MRAETNDRPWYDGFAQAAVTMSLDELGTNVNNAHVVVVGAGQLATGVVRSLLGAATGIQKVTIVNRTVSRAESLRLDLSDARVQTGSLENLPGVLTDARLAIVAVESSSPIITQSHVGTIDHDVLIVDIGVPRAVASERGRFAQRSTS